MRCRTFELLFLGCTETGLYNEMLIHQHFPASSTFAHTHKTSTTLSTKIWQYGACIFTAARTLLICKLGTTSERKDLSFTYINVPHITSLLHGLELCTSHVHSISPKPLTRAAELCDAVPKGACLPKFPTMLPGISC